MATTHQPLLDAPKRKSSPCKSLFLLLSLTAIIGLITIVTTRVIHDTSSSSPPLVARICDQALDRASCRAMVSEVVSKDSNQMRGVDLLKVFLEKSKLAILDVVETASDVSRRINDRKQQAAIADCLELMDRSVDRIRESVSALSDPEDRSHSDAHTWLSSILTNHATCQDGLHGLAQSMMEVGLNDLTTRARISLAMVVAISPPQDEVGHALNGRFPWWVTTRDRRLLEARPKDIKANVVVAKDGSGKYRTVQEAVASAPSKSTTRYVIYVKKGTYKENVEIGSSKTNVMLVGDGMDSTIITGSLNVVDGSTTFRSATVGKDPTQMNFLLMFRYF